MNTRLVWLAQVTSFSYPRALPAADSGIGGGEGLAPRQAATAGRQLTHICFTIRINAGGGQRVIGREALVQVPIDHAERQAQTMLRLVRHHRGGQPAQPVHPLSDEGPNGTVAIPSGEAAGSRTATARRTRKRWLARPTGPAPGFPRTFSLGRPVNLGELRALPEEGMLQRCAEIARQERHVCFTIEITQGGGKLALARTVEVQVQVDAAEQLAHQMLRMSDLAREQNQRVHAAGTGAGKEEPA